MKIQELICEDPLHLGLYYNDEYDRMYRKMLFPNPLPVLQYRYSMLKRPHHFFLFISLSICGAAKVNNYTMDNDSTNVKDLGASVSRSISHGNATSMQDDKEQEQKVEPSTTSASPENIHPNDEKTSNWCNGPVFRTKVNALYWENEFLILIVIAILLAKAYPPLGANYLKPDITSTWIAVIIIFLLAGLSLKTSEFTKAMLNWQYNAMLQLFNFGVVSSIAFGVSRALQQSKVISTDLADGMVVCACMPMTISMVVVLTKAANGDEASSIFNSAAGNLIGVFLSPLLILGYLGVTGDIDLVRVFYQLALRVLLPGVVGQVIQQIKSVNEFATKHKFIFKQLQTYALIFIVYTVFCETFSDDTGSSVGDIFLMILFQLLILLLVMILAWYMLRTFYRNEPKLRVAGVYCCTHKTVAIGIPLITAIYSDSTSTASKVGLYTLPLLIWHPLQLIIGTLLAPRLAKFVDREEIRLNQNNTTDGIHPETSDGNAIDETINDVEEGRR
jgi:solute carrier family 10 (sodium/bile acid cotransporter), member 7